MIHKLYVNIAGWSKLDVSFSKKDIIDTMAYDNKKKKHTHYMIVSEDDHVPPIIPPEWIVLRSQEELDEYINVYNERQRLESMSIIDLKREIVKNQVIKTLKK
jgi:hypothetical protein